MGRLTRLAALKLWARRLRLDLVTVYFATRDQRTPQSLRGLAVLLALYALSPVDMIPDFIPFLGWLDELVLVPLGVGLVLRWLPTEVHQAARSKAEAVWRRPRELVTAVAIGLLWLLAASLVGMWLWRWWVG